MLLGQGLFDPRSDSTDMISQEPAKRESAPRLVCSKETRSECLLKILSRTFLPTIDPTQSILPEAFIGQRE
jgi:hypothetical protein